MKYVTPYQYAKLCGVSPQAIYDRIKSGSLPTETVKTVIGEKRLINLSQNPPKNLTK
jgi:hypothetical protein